MRFQRKLFLLYGVFVLGLLAVWFRVIWLQGPDAETWETRDYDRRHRTQLLEPLRGPIRARAGEVLVEDVRVPQLAFVPAAWKRRARVRCNQCGLIHFHKVGERPPRRCACWRRGTGLEVASLGSTTPRDVTPAWVPLPLGRLRRLEQAAGLEPGELERRGAERRASINAMVKAKKERLEAAGTDEFVVADHLRRDREDFEARPWVVEPDVSPEVVRLIELDEEGQYRGFVITTKLRRRYPQGDFAPQLLGYTSQVRDRAEYKALNEAYPDRIQLDSLIGRAGVEERFQFHLAGKMGRLLLERKFGGGRLTPVEEDPPAPGKSITLSVDLELSRFAEERLAAHGPRGGYAPRGRPSGGFVLMDVTSGEVLVWSEMPRFDPGEGMDKIFDPLRARALPDRLTDRWVLPSREARPDDFDPILFDETMVRPAPLAMSRISQIAVEPGSTLKPLIGLAILHANEPLPMAFPCGSLRSPGCHRCGTVDFETAIKKSCNQYFAFAMRGPHGWSKKSVFVGAFMDQLGFGRSPDPTMPGWSRGTWLRGDMDFAPFAAVSMAQRRALETLGGVELEIDVFGGPGLPRTLGGDVDALASMLSDVMVQIVQESGVRALHVSAHPVLVDGHRITVRYEVRARRDADWSRAVIEHAKDETVGGALRYRALPRRLQKVARQLAAKGGRSARFRVKGSLARQGRVTLEMPFEKFVGRSAAGLPPVVLRDDGRNIGIGQGPVLATPLQMVAAMGTLANEGRFVTPTVVRRVGDQVPGRAPKRDLAWRSDYVHRVRSGMLAVTIPQGGGTAQRSGFGAVPAQVFGKTGTAQTGKDWRPFAAPGDVNACWHHWFVGWAEAPGQRTVAFACVLHARTEAAAGMTSAKVVAEVLEAYYARLRSAAR